METKQLIDAICDALENVTQSVRTRKTGEKSTTKSEVFKYENEAGELFYKYEQVTAEHRFDCEGLRSAPNAIDLIVGGLVSDIIIDDQKNGRMLSTTFKAPQTQSAFDDRYKNPDGVMVNVLSALSKNTKEVNPETVRKQTARLSVEQQKELAIELMKKHGITVDDLK